MCKVQSTSCKSYVRFSWQWFASLSGKHLFSLKKTVISPAQCMHDVFFSLIFGRAPKQGPPWSKVWRS
jgi:hypothetical protein